MTKPASARLSPVVNSFNEWDPLEEVVVGLLDGAVEFPVDASTLATIPKEYRDAFVADAARRAHPFRPPEAVTRARKDLDEFVHILEAEGVTVRRPDPIDHSVPYKTPDFTSPTGFSQCNPRDVMVVIGDEILESSMAWRSRYFEFRAYRRLVKDYFHRGARWTAAPKPQMSDELYDARRATAGGYITTEFEPVFDAADIARCGKDIFIQRSQVTNTFGIEWVRRHLGDRFRVHQLEFQDDRALHIDCTFVPMGPGRVMVCPGRPLRSVPEVLKRSGWEFLPAPRSTVPENFPYSHLFTWLNMNILMLDEKRVIVEREEEPTIRALRDWGFKPIPCSFRSCYLFAGGLHCFTCDIRRRGSLQAYL